MKSSFATEKMMRAVNKALGKEVISVEDDTITVNVSKPYTIVCVDDDDVYNTLSSMLEGIMIMKEVEIEQRMEINAEWIDYMDSYRLYDPKYPQQTIAYEDDLDEAKSRGYIVNIVD